ncbi:hypothetical protein MASR2M48_04350 [Spirochaetota bacterium]
MNTLFNFAPKATNQGIHLLGMLTEAIHTPFMMGPLRWPWTTPAT